MLKFEFVQEGECDEPYYKVMNNNDDVAGSLYFHIKSRTWAFQCWVNQGFTPNTLREIANKADELTASTKQQRILGVF